MNRLHTITKYNLAVPVRFTTISVTRIIFYCSKIAVVFSNYSRVMGVYLDGLCICGDLLREGSGITSALVLYKCYRDTPNTVPLVKISRLHVEYKRRWATDNIRTFQKERKSVSPPSNRNIIFGLSHQ
jgi:hypothetical protein